MGKSAPGHVIIRSCGQSTCSQGTIQNVAQIRPHAFRQNNLCTVVLLSSASIHLTRLPPLLMLCYCIGLLQLAAQERRLDLQLLVMRVTTMIIERVGFKEKKAKSKVKNQGKREQDAKDKFYRDGG